MEKSGKILYCSFCGKNQHEVNRLIAGPSVYICNECVGLCQDVVEENDNVDVLASTNPQAAKLYAFLDEFSERVIEKAVVCRDELILEKLAITRDELEKSRKVLKSKKLVESVPYSEGVYMCLLINKAIGKSYNEKLKLYSVGANVLVSPDGKIKMLP